MPETAAEQPQQPPMTAISQKDYEILIRKATLYDLLCVRNNAEQRIAQIERELAELKQ